MAGNAISDTSVWLVNPHFSLNDGDIMQKKVTIYLDDHRYKKISQEAKKQDKATSTFIKELCLIGWEVIETHKENNEQNANNSKSQTTPNEQRLRVLIQLAYEAKELAALLAKQNYPNIKHIQDEAREFAFNFIERSKNI